MLKTYQSIFYSLTNIIFLIKKKKNQVKILLISDAYKHNFHWSNYCILKHMPLKWLFLSLFRQDIWPLWCFYLRAWHLEAGLQEGVVACHQRWACYHSFSDKLPLLESVLQPFPAHVSWLPIALNCLVYHLLNF